MTAVHSVAIVLHRYVFTIQRRHVLYWSEPAHSEGTLRPETTSTTPSGGQ